MNFVFLVGLLASHDLQLHVAINLPHHGHRADNLGTIKHACMHADLQRVNGASKIEAIVATINNNIILWVSVLEGAAIQTEYIYSQGILIRQSV